MANLASVILEGSGMVPSKDFGNYEYDNNLVVTESSFSDAAVATLFSDIMEAEQSYMVADVVGAATVIRENANGAGVDPEEVQEGVIKNGIAKIKAAFQKFIAKIKEYYKRVIAWFKAMFSNAEDFAKNYGDTIKKKAGKVKDFHYTGYKYTIDKGDTYADGVADDVNKKMMAIIGGYDFVKECPTSEEFNKHLRAKNVISNTYKDGDKPSSTDEVDDFLRKSFKVDDVSELKTKIIELYHDGDDEKSDIKDFEANPASYMVDFLKTSTKRIGEFEKQLRNYEEKTDKIIKKLNGFESVKDEEGGNNLVSNASYISGLMTAFLNLYKVPCETKIAIHKAVTSEFLGVLKKFYNFKGNAVKESTNVFDAEAYAMLENAIILEGEDESEPKDEGEGETTTESVVAGILEQAAKYTF